MFRIEKINDPYVYCQVCDPSNGLPTSSNIYSIKIMNRLEQGTELHLCSNCCKELSGLLKLTRHEAFKMVSIDNID